MKLEQALQSNKFTSETQKAGLNILYTAWWLKTSLSQVLKDFDLTHEQYNVLRILKGQHPKAMCVKDIAGRMIEKNSNVPRILDRLVAKEWVSRTASAEDKRETIICLTEAGIKILATSTKKVEGVMNNLVDMNEKDAAALSKLLEKFRSKE